MQTVRWCLLWLLLPTGIAFSQNNPPVQPEKKQQQRKVEQRGTDKSPIVVKVLPAPNAEEKDAKDESDRKERREEERKLTNATVWLAVITGALAAFTAGLWYATYKLVREAKDTAQRQLRAYVSVKRSDVIGNADTPGFVVEVANSGQTPAH